MTLTRNLHESEIAVAIIAGQVFGGLPQSSSTDRFTVTDDLIQRSVGTAERICQEIISRTDNGEPGPELPFGTVVIDEFSSQRNDGSDKQMGISIAWARSPEIGTDGNSLTYNQAKELLARITTVVENFADEAGGLLVAVDLDDPFESDE